MYAVLTEVSMLYTQNFTVVKFGEYDKNDNAKIVLKSISVMATTSDCLIVCQTSGTSINAI